MEQVSRAGIAWNRPQRISALSKSFKSHYIKIKRDISMQSAFQEYLVTQQTSVASSFT